jgi:hypothetical protein
VKKKNNKLQFTSRDSHFLRNPGIMESEEQEQTTTTEYECVIRYTVSGGEYKERIVALGRFPDYHNSMYSDLFHFGQRHKVESVVFREVQVTRRVVKSENVSLPLDRIIHAWDRRFTRMEVPGKTAVIWEAKPSVAWERYSLLLQEYGLGVVQWSPLVTVYTTSELARYAVPLNNLIRHKWKTTVEFVSIRNDGEYDMCVTEGRERALSILILPPPLQNPNYSELVQKIGDFTKGIRAQSDETCVILVSPHAGEDVQFELIWAACETTHLRILWSGPEEIEVLAAAQRYYDDNIHIRHISDGGQ